MPAIPSSTLDDTTLTIDQSEDIQNKFLGSVVNKTLYYLFISVFLQRFHVGNAEERLCSGPSIEFVKSHKIYRKVMAKQQHELKKLEKKFKKVSYTYFSGCWYSDRAH